MADRRMPVTLAFDDETFARDMRRIRATCDRIAADFAIADATWEPHDWNDF